MAVSNGTSGDVSRGTLAIVAAVCVAAGAAGAYFVSTRAAERPAAVEPDPNAIPAPGASTPAVEQSEGLVAERNPVTRIPSVRLTPPPVSRSAGPARQEFRPARVDAPAQAPEAAVADAPVEAPAAPQPIESARTTEAIAPQPQEPHYEDLELAAQSVIGLQLETTVSSETARLEDEVLAHVTRDVRVGDRVVVPAGSKARGEVTLVERGGRLRQRARLAVRFTSIALADGTRLPIETEPVYREGDSVRNENAVKIGGGAIGGAIIGGILGGAKGAAIGSSIGAGAGTAAVVAEGRNAATLPSGSPVTVRIERAVTVTVAR